MNQRYQIYKCEICGNIVDMVHASAGQLVCCNKPMKHMAEGSVDASKEKHVPQVERNGNSLKVQVGSIAHPMEDKHFIEWIEVLDGEKLQRIYLKPGQKPEAVFNVEGVRLVVREYCNLHGLWKKE